MPEPRTFAARWVFPVSGPPLERGTVTIRGTSIESADSHGRRTADEDLGNVALVPGLVNAHTHLDLSGARGLIPTSDPAHFTDWLRSVIAYRRSRSPEQVQADIRTGLAECLRCGTTLIGDIASEASSWDALRDAPTRAVVFREVIGLREDWPERYEAAQAWLQTTENTETCRRALSPHAPYTVNALLLALLAKNCLNSTIASAVHLAESPGEVELLATRSGPFVTFLAGFGFTQLENLAPSFDRVLELLAAPGPRLFVHGNHLPPDTPFSPNQSLVFCPRTHAAFGHTPHPFRGFLHRGARVCLGTDSLASNPDLDILAEARFLHASQPDFPGDVLLRMITLAGAEALGWADETGSLEPGKSADLVTIPLPNREAADPYDLLLADQPGERRTLFRGTWRS